MKLRWLNKWNVLPLAVILAGAAVSLPVNAQSQQSGDPNEIHQRKENQQDRIAQGVKSGQLTPRETANLENKEAAINHETREDRKANGGTLTPAEKAKVNHQQNKLSRQIYRDKHNGRTDK
jgi:hypothetical protein